MKPGLNKSSLQREYEKIISFYNCTSFSCFLMLYIIVSGSFINTSFAQGTWTALSNASPKTSGGLMLLLSDGAVMAKTNTGTGNEWIKLTPDIHGSYANGTWSAMASMFDDRLYFSSQMLQDGRVYVAGGEYGTGGLFGEIYNPVTNSWMKLPEPGVTISDANSEILPDGRILQAYLEGPLTGTIIYDPMTNKYTTGPSCLGIHNESSWVKLPDNSILFVDRLSKNSERYIPSLNQWIADANVPVDLYDPFGEETGSAFLLPDGRLFFIGSLGYTAYYTPSGNTNPGTWTSGPPVPNGLGAPDAPAAMMVNGKILLTVSPTPISRSEVFQSPTTFYEFNYLTNTFTQISSPSGNLTENYPSLVGNMLDLPDGTVLYTTQGSSQFFVYKPDGSPLAIGKPTVNKITANNNCGGTSYTITGTLFNGISEGASYGDDWQMSTNFPIIRLTNGTNVYYARTYNWNSTGLRRGNLSDNAQFTLPAGLPNATYSLAVTANGISSAPISFTPVIGVNCCVAASEPNESIATAVNFNLNSFLNAALSKSTDLDFFKINVTNTHKLSVTLTGLSANLDLQLYNSSGALLASSANLGTANESIVYLIPAIGIYYVKIFGKNGAFSDNCYTLTNSLNIIPTVSVTAPQNTMMYPAPASITIEAKASDFDGTISNVEFYNGTTLLGSDATTPYSFTWTNVPVGNYSVTAKAFDNSGESNISSIILITVIPNTPPSVSISSPLTGTHFTAPATFSLFANTNDHEGPISKVEFYQGSVKLGEDDFYPSFDWSVVNLPAGVYTFTAKSFDGGGLSTVSDPVTIVIDPAINSCILNEPNPPASQYIVGNEWGDQNYGSTITTESGALKITQRAYGEDHLWLIEGTSISLTSGQTYTAAFDFKDFAGYPIVGIEVGLSSGIIWSGPQLIQPAASVPTGFSSSAFTTKSVNFTATSTGNASLALNLKWGTQPNVQIVDYIKNISICNTVSPAAANARMSSVEGTFATTASISSLNSLTLSPNPTENILSIEANFDTEIELYVFNALGTQIFSQQSTVKSGTKNITMEVANFVSGFYYIQVRSNGKVWKERFVKI